METITSTVCCYCGTGCGVKVRADAGRVIGVEGDPLHPANFGKLCSKGRTLDQTVRSDSARLLYPEWRSLRGEPRARISWEEATELAADKLAAIIQQHGPDAVAFYLSGQLLTEDYYLFNKVARALVGTNNVDTNSRLCMSSAVAGYKVTLGADAPPACYEDLGLADTVLIAGSNTAFAHPILFRRLEEAKAARPDMKVIVIDPRRTDTASIADLYLPILPGTDVALFHAMLNVLVWEDLIDRDYIEQHTEGFAALKARVHEFTPREAAQVCGVPAEDIVKAARWFGAAGKSALSLYTMGLNQSSSGTAKNAALIHLHLATGKIGKPGCGPFSLTGQPNAMGGREAGGMATLLPGHRDPSNAEHRAEVAKLWNVAGLPEAPGLTAVELFDAIEAGKVKAVWIAATNPAQSLPDQAKVRAALAKAELVIVQDAFAGGETVALADLVLPAATWPEKEGTVTNSERRISRVRAAINPPGEARPDWQIAQDIARRIEAKLYPGRPSLFTYENPEAIFEAHKRTTIGRDLDIGGLSYGLLEQQGPQQWPFPAGATQGKTRLYEDGVFPTDSGRARFYDVGYKPVAESVNSHYPLHLTTGRVRDHWHTLSRTGLVPTLNRHEEEPRLSMAPEDLKRFKLAEGDLVRIKNKRGSLVLPVVGDTALRPGSAFLPMHWGGSYLAGLGVNALTAPVLDPVSKQPELKHCAVNVAPAKLGWQAVAYLQGDAATLRPALQYWLAAFPYAVLLPVADGGSGVRLRLAAEHAPDTEVLHKLIADLELNGGDVATFDDPARGIVRRVRVADGKPCAFLLAGDKRAEAALAEWLDGGPTPASLARLLIGGGPVVARARVVCACVGVREDAIRKAVAAGCDVDGLKSQLGCGTGCGSCVPELARLVHEGAATGKPLGSAA
jgi:assimilatory nitrate reductase catalytic subunit